MNREITDLEYEDILGIIKQRIARKSYRQLKAQATKELLSIIGEEDELTLNLKITVSGTEVDGWLRAFRSGLQ